MDGWMPGYGAYTPILNTTTGKLYGRGSADDGYSLYGSLAIFAYLQASNIPHPAASIIIEGGEESGSVDLEFFLDLLADEIGVPDLVVCLDSGSGNYEQVFVTTSLRGGINLNLAFDVVTQAVHSGSAGGMVTDSFRAARRFLDRVEDSRTGEILLESFHVEIPQNRIDEAEVYADVMGESVYDWIPFVAGVGPTLTDVVDLIIAKTWKPTLTITGADGLPSTLSASNVIRTNTDLKFSFRLPPTANSQAALAEFDRLVSEVSFSDGLISYANTPSVFNGWNAEPLEEWLMEVIEESSMDHFGKGALQTGEGGSIPFIGALQERFPLANFVVTGVLGPNSNAHGPNESLDTNYAKDLCSVMVDIVVSLDLNIRKSKQ